MGEGNYPLSVVGAAFFIMPKGTLRELLVQRPLHEQERCKSSRQTHGCIIIGLLTPVHFFL